MLLCGACGAAERPRGSGCSHWLRTAFGKGGGQLQSVSVVSVWRSPTRQRHPLSLPWAGASVSQGAVDFKIMNMITTPSLALALASTPKHRQLHSLHKRR